jgi:hypothetical protein
VQLSEPDLLDKAPLISLQKGVHVSGIATKTRSHLAHEVALPASLQPLKNQPAQRPEVCGQHIKVIGWSAKPSISLA